MRVLLRSLWWVVRGALILVCVLIAALAWILGWWWLVGYDLP